KTGYVSTSYLSSSNPDSQSSNNGNSGNTDTGKETAVTKYVNVDKNSTLNMRSSASTSASVVSKLARGTKVTVTS
ncbi:mannosyl-glycoprotein endo-beta-N-acetylglucosamidase, partial [Niallia sp. SS-2023]|nr:mannosyl-glycoprotein endo-beta-N-acetylglucosamidase [Niallia sp. SS-2023]